MRRVCKAWKIEIDRIRIKELVLTYRSDPEDWDDLDDPYFKWSTGDSINPDNQFEMDLFGDDKKKFQRTFRKLHFLSALKRLKILNSRDEVDHIRHWPGFYIYLTQFRSLEELELCYCLDENVTILLPNLKRLYVDHIPSRTYWLDIDCPLLESLHFKGNCQAIEVIHPETLVHLSGDISDFRYPNRFPNHVFKLKPYRSLKHLELAIGERSNSRASLQLGNHPELKVFKFVNQRPNYAGAKAALTDLLAQKDELRRSDLAIYFGDTPLTGADQIDEIVKAPDPVNETDEEEELDSSED